MQFSNYNEILAFIAVAKEGSFTKAAAKLGVSQSALSQTIRTLEQRLDLRLLVRTTRSVSPTEAGEHMLRTVAPRLDEIEAELAVLSERRLKPAGTIRISAGRRAATGKNPRHATADGARYAGARTLADCLPIAVMLSLILLFSF